MDTAGEGSSKKGRHRQDTGKRPVRKRPSRARKSTSVSQLIQQLRETVFPDPDTQATRSQVLHKTKTYIQELENTLDSLLKMKGNFQIEDSDACSLKDVKEEYMQTCYSIDQGGAVDDTEVKSEMEPMVWYLPPDFKLDLDQVVEELQINDLQSPEPLSSPDLVEFERYLHFYKHTVDMLIENTVVSPEQITHPVVSKAISSLWQDLLQEGKANIYQYEIPQARSTPCSLSYPSDAGCTNGGIRDSGAESQEATSSFLSSTPEEALQRLTNVNFPATESRTEISLIVIRLLYLHSVVVSIDDVTFLFYVDIKNAYFHASISVSYQKFLGIVVQDIAFSL